MIVPAVGIRGPISTDPVVWSGIVYLDDVATFETFAVLPAEVTPTSAHVIFANNQTSDFAPGFTMAWCSAPGVLTAFLSAGAGGGPVGIVVLEPA